MEIHFQATDHVVAVEIVAEQHIGTKLCSCNTFEERSHLLIIRPKLGFNVPFNSQGHIGTGPQHCHLWDSNPQR